MFSLSRRKLLQTTVAGAALLSSGAPLSAFAQDRRKLTVVSWGGIYGEAMKAAWIEPFQIASNIDCELRTQTGMMETLASLRTNKGRLDIDVWVTGISPTVLAKEDGLLEAIPVDRLINASYLPENMVNDTYVGVWRLAFGIIYNSETVPFEITKWTDLFDPRLKDKIVAPTGTAYNGRFIALLAWLAGGDEENIDPAFKLAAKLKPNVSVFTNPDSDQVRLLSSGEVDVAAFAPIGNYLTLRKASPKFRFVYPEPYIPMSFNNVVIPKGADVEAATKFIDFAISKEPQEDICERLGFLPVNKDATLPSALRETMPPTNIEIRYPDEVAISKYLTVWADRWTSEIQN